jgi:hypothetical protein
VRLVTEDGPVAAIAGTTVGGLLDELSTLQPGDTASLTPALTALRRPGAGGSGGSGGSGSGGLVVAVLGQGEAGLATALTGLRGRGAPAIAILVDVAAWGGAPPGSAPDLAATRTALARAGWAVVIAERGTNLASVWPQATALAGRGGLAGVAAGARASASASVGVDSGWSTR